MSSEYRGSLGKRRFSRLPRFIAVLINVYGIKGEIEFVLARQKIAVIPVVLQAFITQSKRIIAARLRAR